MGNLAFKLAAFDLDGTLVKIHQPAKLETSQKLEKLRAKKV